MQPLKLETNYFDFFELQISFVIEQSILERKYKDWNKLLHPDKFSQKSSAEKDHSSTHASFLTVAYSVLKNPVTRAQYLV